MANVASKLITQANDVKRFRSQNNVDTHSFFSQYQLAERLKENLLKSNNVSLNKKQDENLVSLIADRVTGVIDAKDLNAQLAKGISTGGLALDEKEADSLTRYFEKLIAQGVDVSYKS